MKKTYITPCTEQLAVEKTMGPLCASIEASTISEGVSQEPGPHSGQEEGGNDLPYWTLSKNGGLIGDSTDDWDLWGE